MPEDVNEAFASVKLKQLADECERETWLRQQIADKNARLMPDGVTVQMLKGWDAGEVFQLDGTPVTGLDLKSDGELALYLKDKPAWHALGRVVPGGLHTVGEVLEAAGLNYEVAKKHAVTLLGDGSVLEIPGLYDTYRTDTGQVFGRVGSGYTPFQNHDSFGMLEGLIGAGMVVETAGSWRGGARTFMSARAPDDMIVDEGVINDVVRLYVMISNSHDGETAIRVVLTPWRPVCTNTEAFGLRDARRSVTFRHTRNVLKHADQAATVLGLARAYAEEYVHEENELVRVPFTDNDVDTLIADIWGSADDDAPPEVITRFASRRDRVHDAWDVERERCGANAYAAERAITGYVDHYADLRPRGVLRGNRLAALGQALLEDANSGDKVKAHSRLMRLVRR